MEFKIISDAINNSSPQIKRLIFSSELGQRVNDVAFENNLNEDKAINLADEVGYVILGLKPRFSFAESLKEAGLDQNVAKKIATEIESKIFIELDKIKNESKETDKIKNLGEAKEKSNNVGQSFEDMILNQAKSMQPAREEGEEEKVMSNEMQVTEEKKPEQNKVENKTWQNPFSAPSSGNKRDDYKQGQDPYREPI